MAPWLRVQVNVSLVMVKCMAVFLAADRLATVRSDHLSAADGDGISTVKESSVTGKALKIDWLKTYVEAGIDELTLLDHAPAGDLSLAMDSAANMNRLVAALRGTQSDGPPVGIGYVALAMRLCPAHAGPQSE
jgi:hypothetical protein